MDEGGTRLLEIRSYKLRAGMRPEFHRLMVERSLPMLENSRIDVVAFGPSLDDVDAYFLMRAYAGLDDLNRSEEAFYGSNAWRQGPRQAVLDCIETYTSITMELDAATIDRLRRRPG
jgi:hypothetical protein